MATTTTATPVVNFITGNKNKLSEVKAILEPTIQVNSQALDLVEVQGTLEEVTLAKCRAAAEQVKFFILFIYFIQHNITLHQYIYSKISTPQSN